MNAVDIIPDPRRGTTTAGRTFTTKSITIDNTPLLQSIRLASNFAFQPYAFTGQVIFPGGGVWPHRGHAPVIIDIIDVSGNTVKSYVFDTLNGRGSAPNIIDLSKQYTNLSVLPDGNYTAKFTARAINGTQATTTLSFQIKRSPTVHVILGKTQVTGCETLTGSLTISDPSGQGGTVTLSLPDGSTQSFTYTGGTSAPIPFSYAVSEPVGSTLTFTATATSNSGATSKQPATASANIIAGGLNVTITPAKAVVEPTLNNRRSWMQTVGANQTSVIIDVKDPNNQPVSGASISLKTQLGAGNFGGHDHGADPANAALKPLGTTSAIVDNNDGTYTTTYTASMFASEEKVVADASFRGCIGSAASPVITSKVSNLQAIVLPAGGLHTFVGGTCQHYGAATPWKPDKTAACGGITGSNNQYLTAYRAGLLDRLLKLYEQRWGAGLYINDASLKFGGAFDTNGNWAYKPHSNHRLGLDVDLALKDTSIPMMTLPTSVGADVVYKKLLSAIEELDSELLKQIEVKKHGGNHLHIKPNMNNWRGK
ncbi:Ig-like domain-containing protein [Ghiorsea bivora]|uniref:hypothetical protein n=1 Tax=Ghiorsea bivora TaxID=1485545 RepID=UPI0012FD720C|nr:hypothetical protein [Ghiorsea bivora]